jgi:conjugal transfer pilus assembly protein TraL
MSKADLSHFIPRRLDSQGKFLFWDLDVAGIGIAGMMTGQASGYPVMGLAIGIAAAYGFSKMKSGKHPGIASHLLYWWTGMPTPKELPGSHLRELNG